MTPTKQTVYSQVTIEEDYLIEQNHIQSIDGDFYLEQKGYFFTPEQLNEYTANVVRQALETAAEKAELLPHDVDIDLKSITNTLEETCKKFEV